MMQAPSSRIPPCGLPLSPATSTSLALACLCSIRLVSVPVNFFTCSVTCSANWATDYIKVSEKIGQLKMVAPDGKQRLTDCANTEALFRVIQ